MSSSKEQELSTWAKIKQGASNIKQSASNKITSLKSNINTKIKSDDATTDSVMFSPLRFTEIIFVYSPIFVTIIITSLSFLNEDWKGIIYLAFLIAACLLRDIIHRFGFPDKKGLDKKGKNFCDNMIYTDYGNVSFSSYVFAFTITYLSTPMFINKALNPFLFAGLLLYCAFDIFAKFNNDCVTSAPELFINVLAGICTSLTVVLLMNLGGSKKYLFFNEIQSTKEQCSQPTKQTFKCDVYKDGKLVKTL